tara:strand:+ start:92 stop:565 length:474 start_codon:yes stop_codon:yes gene_type:complete
MKITKNQLRQIINEELDVVMAQEGIFFDNPIADKLRGRRPRAPESEVTDEDKELSYKIGELEYADDLDLNPRSLAKLRIDQPEVYQVLQMIVDKEIDYDGFRRYSNQLIRKVYDAKVAKGFKDDREKIAQRNKDSIIAARKREKEADVLGRRHELDI